MHPILPGNIKVARLIIELVGTIFQKKQLGFQHRHAIILQVLAEYNQVYIGTLSTITRHSTLSPNANFHAKVLTKDNVTEDSYDR